MSPAASQPKGPHWLPLRLDRAQGEVESSSVPSRVEDGATTWTDEETLETFSHRSDASSSVEVAEFEGHARAVNEAQSPAIRVAPPPSEKKWRLNRFSLIPATLAIVGVLTLSYPTVASWLTQYNQSKIVTGYERQVEEAKPEKAVQLEKAREYNDALSVGAFLQANTNVPTGAGSSADESLDYDEILTANGSGLMGRIKIPSIDVDLPIYHGTSDTTLLEGIGHLEGTSLPVGGESTRTVLTGHRGLATAKMFTDLDKVEMGDTFTLEIFGEVLTYRVSDKKVVAPDETESLRVEPGRDLATLVTCTPLGINTHRILLTGERITPTPVEDVERAGKAPTVPYFPWWGIWIPAGFVLVGIYVWWAGRPVAAKKKRDEDEVGEDGQPAENSDPAEN